MVSASIWRSHRSSPWQTGGEFDDEDAAVDVLKSMVESGHSDREVWIPAELNVNPRAIPVLEHDYEKFTKEEERAIILIALAECGDRSRLRELLAVARESKLAGHVFGAERAFEKVAEREFLGNHDEIEQWIEEQYRGSGSKGSTGGD